MILPRATVLIAAVGAYQYPPVNGIVGLAALDALGAEETHNGPDGWT
jgi:hypothetical protein